MSRRAIWGVVRIDDVRSILTFRIGFSLWLSALAGQLRLNFPVVLEASRRSIERGEKTPKTPKISALLRKRPVLLRAQFRPY